MPLRFWDGKEYDEEEINAGGGGVKKKSKIGVYNKII